MTSADTSSPPPRVIVLGALSAIAEAAARLWAEQGCGLMLAARDEARLSVVASDLAARGGTVKTWSGDLASADPVTALSEMVDALGGVDIVLLAYGVLGDQETAEKDVAHAREILDVNFTSAAGWCLVAANVLEAQGSGSLVVIGSVAGDRGRASNYVYGAAKSGLAALVQGIAHRLSRAGARAVLVKPGFVDTPMTAGIAKKGPLWAKPEAIASAIVSAAPSNSRRGPVIYTPSFWRWIMLAIRSTPSFIFHKTKL